MSKPLINLIGQRFGMWTVLARAENNFGTAAGWVCKCDCGTERDICGKVLRNKKSTSCGCSKGALISSKKIRHGQSRRNQRTVEHGIWCGMKSRCADTSNPNYGGRGIVVCERWNSFENFIADMGRRPSPIHSIERKDVNGNYEPGNCKWATPKEQARNQSNSKLVTFRGRTQAMIAWSEEVGIKNSTLHHRLSKLGWSAEKALTTPTQNTNRKNTEF